jgi:serine protease Do
VRRGTIGGITAVDRVTPQYAEEVGARDTSGAVIVRMSRNSRAYQLGIQPGDIIVAFNGKKVDDPSQLFRMVADAEIGSTATLRVFREGRTVEFKVPITSQRTR